MAKRGDTHPDRFLVMRGGRYQYRRRVPTEVAHLDSRSPQIRISLKTDDLAKARALRDVYEKSDGELWGSLILGEQDPWAKHEAAQRVARALGFNYQPASVIAAGPIHEILRRIDALSANGAPQALVVDAVLGGLEQPAMTITKAFDVYVEKIVPHELRGKSASQRKRWLDGKTASVRHFVELVGDLDIGAISRDDARRYYDHWMDCIAPKQGKPTHTADIGNRRMGDLGGLFGAYFTYMQEPDRANPFDKLRFKRKGAKQRRRQPFSHDWLSTTVMTKTALAGLNIEARAIFIMVANTGARPSEIASLRPERILLDHDVPHIRIEPDEDPDDPREIKTESSIRIVPLVGMALEVMKRFPSGFTRYKDKSDTLSATINKYLVENKLLESDRQTFYSLRHSFEDRMKDAKIDSELRRILMGHSIDRPEYGEGGSLKLRQEAMELVALPHDPGII